MMLPSEILVPFLERLLLSSMMLPLQLDVQWKLLFLRQCSDVIHVV